MIGITEKQMDSILMGTEDPDSSAGGSPVPAATTLLYRVCGKDPEKFDEALRLANLFVQAGYNLAASRIQELEGVVKPFADHAEAWTRKGYGPDDSLVETHWTGGPAAEEGEDESLDALFLRVSHLINAKEVLNPEGGPTGWGVKVRGEWALGDDNEPVSFDTSAGATNYAKTELSTAWSAGKIRVEGF